MKKCINSLAFLLVEGVARRLVVNNKLTSNNIGTSSQVDEYSMRTRDQLTWEKDVSFWYRFLFSNKHELNKRYDLSSKWFLSKYQLFQLFRFLSPIIFYFFYWFYTFDYSTLHSPNLSSIFSSKKKVFHKLYNLLKVVISFSLHTMIQLMLKAKTEN